MNFRSDVVNIHKTYTQQLKTKKTKKAQGPWVAHLRMNVYKVRETSS